jgi:hypothetical protein
MNVSNERDGQGEEASYSRSAVRVAFMSLYFVHCISITGFGFLSDADDVQSNTPYNPVCFQSFARCCWQTL